MAKIRILALALCLFLVPSSSVCAPVHVAAGAMAGMRGTASQNDIFNETAIGEANLLAIRTFRKGMQWLKDKGENFPEVAGVDRAIRHSLSGWFKDPFVSKLKYDGDSVIKKEIISMLVGMTMIGDIDIKGNPEALALVNQPAGKIMRIIDPKAVFTPVAVNNWPKDHAPTGQIHYPPSMLVLFIFGVLP